MTQLSGKTIVISGAASGMGRACAELAHRRDARVVALDRDEAGLADLASHIDAHCEVCDLSDVAALPALVQRCIDGVGGPLHGLVNSAGIHQTREILDITPEDFDRIFAINLRGLFFLQQAVARTMVETGGGSIVNFASTAARMARPITSHYAASKAAVVSFTRSAAVALTGQGVRVNAVLPGTIETPMVQHIRELHAQMNDTTPEQIDESWRSQHPMGRHGDPLEVAEVVAFLLSDAASYVSGESIGINGGFDEA